MLTNVSSDSKHEQGEVEVWQVANRHLISVMDRMMGMRWMPLARS